MSDPYMIRALSIGGLATLTLLVAGCDDSETTTVSPLVSDESAVLKVLVVQDLATPEPTTPTPEPVGVYSDSGVLAATADASPRVVPIAWGEPQADAATDYMQVTVAVESEFADRIVQVELNIDLNGDGVSDWCEPMRPDDLVEGQFFLQLQPACDPEERDELTGECVVQSSCEGWDGYSEGCREDWLTFTLWDATSTDCHNETTDE